MKTCLKYMTSFLQNFQGLSLPPSHPPSYLLLLKCWTYLTSFLQNIQGLAHKMKFFTWKKSLLSPQILTLKIERRQEARFGEIYSIIWVWRRSTQNSDSNNLPLAPSILEMCNNHWKLCLKAASAYLHFLLQFLQTFSLTASNYMLVALALDRWLSVGSSQWSNHQVLVVIVIVIAL